LARILFGSEFGANLGHIYPMLRIADLLSSRGHEVIFAARDVPKTHQALKDRGYRVVQAPYWINPSHPDIKKSATPSYADVMARQGFIHKETLEGMFAAWSNLVTLLKADVIIADHSPGLSLAARGMVPMINIGNGFTLPPSHLETYPPVISEGKPLIAQSRILDVFNDVLQMNGREPLPHLPQIFDTEGQYVCTVPQLDPYVDYRSSNLVGPLEQSLDFAPLPKRPHVFLYMAREAGRNNVALDAIKRLGVTATVFLRDAPEKTVSAYASTKIEMLRAPADFSEALPKSTVVIHSGGGGTSTSCLMTGRVQITFPTHSETMLNSKLMALNGVAKPVRSSVTLDQMTGILKHSVENREMQNKALSIAKQLSEGDWRSALKKITDHVERLI